MMWIRRAVLGVSDLVVSEKCDACGSVVDVRSELSPFFHCAKVDQVCCSSNCMLRLAKGRKCLHCPTGMCTPIPKAGFEHRALEFPNFDLVCNTCEKEQVAENMQS